MMHVILAVLFALSPFWNVQADREARESVNAEPQDDAANVNGFFDSVITRVADTLKAGGYDPYHLPDHYVLNLTFKDYLHITWHTGFGLYDGKVYNLTTIHRDGNSTLEYNNTSGALELRGHVAFDSIRVDYAFAAQTLNVGPRGTIHATLAKIGAYFGIGIFPADFSVKLQEFNFEDVSNIDVDVNGFGLLDPLASRFADGFTDVFKKLILKVVEQEVRQQAENAVASFKPGDLLG